MDKHVVLVTGTSSGLGNVIARALAQQGKTVYAAMRDVNGRNAELAHSLRSASSAGSLHVIELDVCDELAVETAVEAILKSEGRLDILINNAGIGGSGY